MPKECGSIPGSASCGWRKTADKARPSTRDLPRLAAQVIATIDADLQNDPEEIPRLLPLLEGKDGSPTYDMVTGWRQERQDTPFRRWQSRQANRIRNWISQETVNDSASSLKLYKRARIEGLKLFNGITGSSPRW